MNNYFKNIKILFEYFNGGMFVSFLIFLISTIYIGITEKNKKIRIFFTWYTLLILIIIWNPLCLYILNKFINFSSLYRLYYMLPLYVTIAYALTKFITHFDNKLKYILLILICIYICFFNENNVFFGYTAKYNNFYKLPDETIKIANIIYNDDTYKVKKAIVPYGMSSQIQQIHSSIELLYTRIVSNPKYEDGSPMPMDTDTPIGYEPIEKINEGDTKYIDNLCRNERINYVVFSKDLVLKEPMENYEFNVLEETDENIVYIRSK